MKSVLVINVPDDGWTKIWKFECDEEQFKKIGTLTEKLWQFEKEILLHKLIDSLNGVEITEERFVIPAETICFFF